MQVNVLVAILAAFFMFFVVEASLLVWRTMPHRKAQESDILLRLSEIHVAIRDQTTLERVIASSASDSHQQLIAALQGIHSEIHKQTEIAIPALKEATDRARATSHSEDVAHKALVEILAAINNIPCPTLDSGAIVSAISTPRADVQGLITKLDELQLFIKKQDHKKLMVLDALVEEFNKFSGGQKKFLDAIFNGGSISTVDDATAADMEKVNGLMRRYGLTQAEAVERVRGAAPYQRSSGTMGMEE